eukprot:TRINITY_DN530_c0_g1_i1.p1 TRINITY_DN530_c0_g1~~TRINITY_DN530_c0_g1_i1.p1  ORF type:complete len:118 (+),score=23.14 TRINITY_DN530_c0_g1_i1:78-431(+)
MEEKPVWIQLQQKVFSRWCNKHLSSRNLSVGEGTELAESLKTGIVLHRLLEILNGDKYWLPQPNPKLKFHMIQNIDMCLQIIKQKSIPLVGIGPEDIYDGKEKLVLGLIWTLIYFYK